MIKLGNSVSFYFMLSVIILFLHNLLVIILTFQANPKLSEFQYKPLQFEKELDNFFIGNSATGENAWVPTGDEPIPSEAPFPTSGDFYTGLEYMEFFNTTILSDATAGVDKLKQVRVRN